MTASQTEASDRRQDPAVDLGRDGWRGPATAMLRQLRERSFALHEMPWSDPLKLVFGLSVLLLIVTSDKSQLLLAGGLFVAALCLWRPALCERSWFWLTIAAALAVRNLAVWLALDDHIAVANYWFAAVGLSLLTPDPRRAMAHNARWLIGLIFLFATLWKASSAEYISGAFFEYTLLLDDRFLTLARWLGGIETEHLAANYQQMAAQRESTWETNQFLLHGSARVDLLAQVLTWWTVVIEGLVAICFLCSRITVLHRLRNWLLMLFAMTTYVPVPVTGFCATLMTLGVAQSTHREKHAKIAYLLVLGLILIWTPIWRNVVYLQ